ncbi:hypothetical protein D0Z08_10850 [Nocardioides immobilis]|uniref:Uncharacterized protein n=1 Tax=Nocardioides immobilis TaxID=2049295 RepID=A0A417Y3B9_9ACTN|nr:hypothetical protein [Nocardioides immobilis]RHW27158.1 hypothetical protein D0Z08_10850 [Nocardioides immobilis]
MAEKAKSYSRRLFLTYREVIEGRVGDVHHVTELAARSGVDLEQRLTFAEWYAEEQQATVKRPTAIR